MRITWLLEAADQLWGGVKVALEDANWLHRRGHQVTVLSRSGPPSWMRLECAFQRVPCFRPEHLPAGDVLIGTFWSTVPWAASAGPDKGVPVHYCQGYEGDAPENAPLRDRIEAAYRLPRVQHVTISAHLTQLLRQRFGVAAKQVAYTIDHAVHHAGPERASASPLRVGLVGPYQIAWKDLGTGFAACRLAHAAGQKLVLVRATNTAPDPAELDTPFPVEWHRQLPPAQMGDFYRSLDVFLGTSSGPEEGFFLPAVEAMACGVPAVLTEVPCFLAHADVLGNDRFALWVPPRDAAAMAEALVIAGAIPEVRSSLRREGLQLAGHYHSDRHGEELEAALVACVEANATNERHSLRLVAGPPPPDEPSIATLLRQLRAAAARMQRDEQHAEAASLFAAAHCLQPDDAVLLRALAESHQRAGAASAALAAFDQLAARGIDDEALHVGRGHALHALDRLHEAAQAFRAAIAVGARTADAFNRLGVVLFQAG
ncbi:MAG TPA: glycosyltransferase family 4 protein, partial [Planctomycetota bacterium]|nr:glycosyltransferase family 4 protein [Planctomycetota bacterium]